LHCIYLVFARRKLRDGKRLVGRGKNEKKKFRERWRGMAD